MTKQEVLKYLNQKGNSYISDILYIYLRNDSRYYKQHFLPAVEFARKKIKNKQYDSVLFVQYIKLGIDSILKDTRFRKEYYDLPKNIDLPTKYMTADNIARYIECDYLNYSRRWR